MPKNTNDLGPTRGQKGKNKYNSKEKSTSKVLFDAKARVEYLTGFEKRNKDRKQDAIEKTKRFELNLKREKRKEKQHKLDKIVNQVTQEIQEREANTSNKIKETTSFVDDGSLNQHTTVTIESLTFYTMYLHSPLLYALWLVHKTQKENPIGRLNRSIIDTTMSFCFKQQYELNDRKEKARNLRTQFPDRIPVICEKLGGSDLPDLASERFLVPSDFTVGNLTTVIRNRIKLSANKSIFLFVGNSLLPAHQVMASVYQQKQDQDGFLYVLYSGENTFG